MKRHGITMLMIVLFCSAGVTTAEADEASCLLRVRFDEHSLPLSYDGLNAMILSSGIGGAAIDDAKPVVEALKRSDMMFASVMITFEQAGHAPDTFLLGQLTVTVPSEVPDSRAHARTILEGICKRLDASLEKIGESDHQLLAERVARSAQALEAAKAQQAEIRRLDQELRDEAGVLNLSRKDILNEARVLSDRRQSLELQMRAQHARYESMAAQIAEISNRIQGDADNDPVLAELNTVVELRGKEVERMIKLAEAEQVSENEVNRAREQLAHARANLAQQRRDVAMASGGDMLKQFNADLIEMTVNLAELRAQLQGMEEQIERIQSKKLLSIAARYEDEVEMRSNFVFDTVRRATHEHQALEAALRSYRMPELTVIGGAE